MIWVVREMRVGGREREVEGLDPGRGLAREGRGGGGGTNSLGSGINPLIYQY